MNNRRKLVIALGASALQAAFSAFPQQQGKVWRIGILGYSSVPSVEEAFRAGLREAGYVEGRNLTFEIRWADGKAERLPCLASELVDLKVDVILTAGTAVTRVARNATSTIPIVMIAVSDPLRDGLVKSLARPEGNVTGFANLSSDLGTKRLEMLLSMVPKLQHVAVLVNPANPAHVGNLKTIQSEGMRLGIGILSAEARTPQEIDEAFALIVRGKAGAVLIVTDPFFSKELPHIVAVASKNRLPSIYGLREYAEHGGLMSYGESLAKTAGRAATYMDKIFKGAKPSDLPVEQVATIELFINRRTAKSLGLTIPQSLLISADKIIE
ncbi:MAG: ABC transporter substrate-binding protein [Proteobacteria bacterium]|nr:ABC transporter substrate-binding protein [Pseudomonadota bacterium]